MSLHVFAPSPSVDWLVLWKWYYYPLFFWSYILPGIPLRIITARRLSTASPLRAWITSSVASAPFVFLMPVATLPAFAAAVILVGHPAVYSIFMAVPIAMCIGLTSALIDAALLRFAVRQTVSRKAFLLFLVTNTLNVSLAIAIVLAWAATRPVEVIAVLWNWR